MARFRVPSTFIVAIVFLCSAVFGERLTGQMTYVPRDVSTPPPDFFVNVASPFTCKIDGQPADTSMPDETFVKTYVGAYTNVVAHVTGACDWFYGGQFYTSQTRYLNRANFLPYTPVSGPDTAYYFPNTYTQTMDTRNPGTTSGPLYWSSYGIEGRHRLDFQTEGLLTNCTIRPHYSVIVGTHLNVMQCRPEWAVQSGLNLHGEPGPTTINLPPSLSSIRSLVDAAKAGWESKLGITISVTTNAECSETDGRCINISNNYGSEPNDRTDACAGFRGGSAGNVTGRFLTPSLIRLRPSAFQPGAVTANVQRNISHELGHYFGLENREHSSCTTASSIMGPGPCEWQPEPAPNTFANSPTDSDAESVSRSTRGNGNRKVCGWQ